MTPTLLKEEQATTIALVSPEGSALPPIGHSTLPRTRLFALRAVAFACRDASSLDELDERSSHRFAGLLQAMGSLDTASLPPSTVGLARALDAVCEDLAALADTEEASALDDLARQLGQALRFNEAETRLLQIALHTDASIELRRCLDLAGEVDDEGMSRLLERVLVIDQYEIGMALHRDNPLRMMGSNEVGFCSRLPSDFLRLTRKVSKVLKRAGCTADEVLSVFFRLSPPPRLGLEDFNGAGPAVDLMLRYLSKTVGEGRPGVNILLHGKPGTGKTELVRTAGKAFGATLLEVPSVDEDRDPLPAWRRLTAYTAAQETTRERPGTLILFDEVEDIFPQASHPGGFESGSSSGLGNRNKGWLTQVLETNPTPTVWVCNAVEQMDPAFIRRFDMVVELSGPDRSTREKLVAGLFKDIPLTEVSLTRICEQSDFAPGHLERIASVIRTLAPVDAEEGARMLAQLSQQTLQALQIAPTPAGTTLLPYRTDCVNTDIDLGDLAEALKALPSARLCLYGPPGTGKTEWARQLAASLGKPLLVKRASDLLSKYVGETERAIRAAFNDAAHSGAVLLMDEADSLLRSRDSAKAGWEASMVNEMLTAMEAFQGIFVASTNLIDSLDPASARRFDFKVGFRELTEAQARSLFQDLLASMGEPAAGPTTLRWHRLKGVTPGDFATVFRQARLFRSRHNAESLQRLLEKEVSFRGGVEHRLKMGFV